MKRLSYFVFIIVMMLGFMAVPAYAVDYYSADTVKEVQAALNEEGYNCGSVDGIIGNNTRAQIGAFRRDAHLGDNQEIDGALMWALGLTDEPYWLPFQSTEDSDNVISHLSDEYRSLTGQAYKDIGAVIQNIYDTGNYVRYGDDFEFGVRAVSDNGALLLTTALWDGAWHLVSICNYDTGEYYYKNEDFFEDTAVSPYSASAASLSPVIAGEADNRAVVPSGSARIESTPEPIRQEEPASVRQNGGNAYVLNMNTKKFHYPSCNSADEIKPSNRWDYTGTREEVIAMGYVPCKRCNP